MRELGPYRQKLLAIEAKTAAASADARGEIEIYRPVGSIEDAREISAEEARQREEQERAEQNFLNLKTEIAKIVTPYNNLFKEMTLQEHVKQNPRARGLLRNKFKVEIPVEKGTAVLKYHKQKNGGDVDLIPDSYLLERGEGLEKKKLEVGFVGGEISKVSFAAQSGNTPFGHTYNVGGDGAMPSRFSFASRRTSEVRADQMPEHFTAGLREDLNLVPKKIIKPKTTN